MKGNVVTKVKRIYNPVTGTYYTIKQRSSKYKPGEIKGIWPPPNERTEKLKKGGMK